MKSDILLLRFLKINPSQLDCENPPIYNFPHFDIYNDITKVQHKVLELNHNYFQQYI
jgi:hypothetical protein